jgi:hypothetical protein
MIPSVKSVYKDHISKEEEAITVGMGEESCFFQRKKIGFAGL